MELAFEYVCWFLLLCFSPFYLYELQTKLTFIAPGDSLPKFKSNTTAFFVFYIIAIIYILNVVRYPFLYKSKTDYYTACPRRSRERNPGSGYQSCRWRSQCAHGLLLLIWILCFVSIMNKNSLIWLEDLDALHYFCIIPDRTRFSIQLSMF